MPTAQLPSVNFYTAILVVVLLFVFCGHAHSTSVAVLESNKGFVILADSKQSHQGGNSICRGNEVRKVFIVQNRFALTALGNACGYLPPPGNSTVLADFAYDIDSAWVRELQENLPNNASFTEVVGGAEIKFSALVPKLQSFLTAGSIPRDDPFNTLQTFITFVIAGYYNGNPTVCELKFYIDWDTRTLIKATPQMIKFESRYYVFGSSEAITDIRNPDSYAHSQARACCLTAVSHLLSGTASLDESISLGKLLVKIEEKINPDKVGGEITGVQILPDGKATELANATPLPRARHGKQQATGKTK